MTAQEIPRDCLMYKKWKYLYFLQNDKDWSPNFSDINVCEEPERLLHSNKVKDLIIHDESFPLVFSAIADDPQLVVCSDGVYRFCRYSGSAWGWVCTPTHFSKKLWKILSSLYRRFRSAGHSLHRDNMFCLDDWQFLQAQRLIREVYGDEIGTSKMKKELAECKNP